MKKIYLASPYTHKDPAVMQERFERVCKKAGALMNEGYLVFSPIAHGHPIALAVNLPKDYEFWEEYCRSFVQWADEVWILKLDGWHVSVGIEGEIITAQAFNKLIKFIKE